MALTGAITNAATNTIEPKLLILSSFELAGHRFDDQVTPIFIVTLLVSL
jgi:hypothetical protein